MKSWAGQGQVIKIFEGQVTGCKNVTTFSARDMRDQLAKAHRVDKNDIVVKNLYVRTFNIVYTVLNLTAAAIRKIKNVPRKLKDRFHQFVNAKIHPLLYRPTFTYSILMQEAIKPSAFTHKLIKLVHLDAQKHILQPPDGLDMV
jgi:hypothetical protein